MHDMISYLYSDVLEVDGSALPCIITEPPLCARTNREKLIEMLFEHMHAPAAYVALSGIMDLFSAGRTTGLVLDSGHGVTQVVPVYDGHTLPHAIDKVSLGGQDITMQLGSLMHNKAPHDLDDATLSAIKESLCYVPKDYSSELLTHEAATAPFTLPDGSTVEIGSERFTAPEALFNPPMLDFLDLYEHKGVHASIAATIGKCDMDLRRDLYDNVLVCGGNTLFSGRLSLS